jgi:hypothetical protein
VTGCGSKDNKMRCNHQCMCCWHVAAVITSGSGSGCVAVGEESMLPVVAASVMGDKCMSIGG